MTRSPVSQAIRNARGLLFAVGLFSGVVNILALTGSFYMLQVYDRVLPSKSVATLIGFTVLLVVLYAAFGLLDFARVRILARAGGGLDRQLRDKVLSALINNPRASDGPQAMRDLDQVRTFFSGLGPTAFFDLPWLPVYLLLIYFLHPLLGMFAIAGVVALVLIALATELRMRRPARAASESVSLRAGLGDTIRRNADAIRAMGLEPVIQDRWRAASERQLGDQLAVGNVTSGFGTASKVARLLLQSGVLGLGAWLAINGELSAGALIAGSIILGRCLAPVEISIANWGGFVQMRQSLKRLDGLLNALPERDTTIALPQPTQSLSVKDLAVAPPGEPLATLTGITFELTAGDGLGVIGPSASGKSTLARAIVGAWPPLPRGGSVRLDGATLDQWSPAAIGRAIGYLPQEVSLFDGSIGENIARLAPEPDSEAVIAAARLAGIHEMVLALPHGYGTRVGDNGSRLSSGQRQRVALARALYGNPFLVVLDEPNANLDAEGDRALSEAVKSVRARGGIVVLVAHRPSGLIELNKAIAIGRGRMIAFGPRDEVLSRVLIRHDGTQKKPAEAAATPRLHMVPDKAS